MANGVSNADLLDLTKTTLENLPDLEIETALTYQNYPVCNQWFQGDKIQSESGTSISRRIILDTSGNARHVRLFQKTAINVADVVFNITAPWVQLQTHWSVERRELLRNRKPAQYVKLISVRRQDGVLDMADLLEERAWIGPESETDDLNPRGLPYWISMNQDAVATEGFLGYQARFGSSTTGTTSNTKGGIDASSTNTKWRNWCSVYVAIDAAFVKQLRKAFHKTNFQSPIIVRDLIKGPTSAYRLYMGIDELVEYEDLVTKANDNLGRDLDPFHGMTTFKRLPIVVTPILDDQTVTGGSGTSNSPNAVYGINHSKFFPMVQEGDWMREDDPMIDVEMHNVQTVFIDCSYQFFCTNVREGGFVLHKQLAA